MCAVVAVGRCAGGNHPAEVSSNHPIRAYPADALPGPLAERVDPAWPQHTVTATKPQVAERADVLHRFEPVPAGLDVGLTGVLEHIFRCRVRRPFNALLGHLTLLGWFATE